METVNPNQIEAVCSLLSFKLKRRNAPCNDTTCNEIHKCICRLL